MLSSLPNLKTINLSRNELTNFPSGGPQQFSSAVVFFLLQFFIQFVKWFFSIFYLKN